MGDRDWVSAQVAVVDAMAELQSVFRYIATLTE